MGYLDIPYFKGSKTPKFPIASGRLVGIQRTYTGDKYVIMTDSHRIIRVTVYPVQNMYANQLLPGYLGDDPTRGRVYVKVGINHHGYDIPDYVEIYRAEEEDERLPIFRDEGDDAFE